jgi:hypothetical protein
MSSLAGELVDDEAPARQQDRAELQVVGDTHVASGNAWMPGGSVLAAAEPRPILLAGRSRPTDPSAPVTTAGVRTPG